MLWQLAGNPEVFGGRGFSREEGDGDHLHGCHMPRSLSPPPCAGRGPWWRWGTCPGDLSPLPWGASGSFSQGQAAAGHGHESSNADLPLPPVPQVPKLPPRACSAPTAQWGQGTRNPHRAPLAATITVTYGTGNPRPSKSPVLVSSVPSSPAPRALSSPSTAPPSPPSLQFCVGHRGPPWKLLLRLGGPRGTSRVEAQCPGPQIVVCDENVSPSHHAASALPHRRRGALTRVGGPAPGQARRRGGKGRCWRFPGAGGPVG